MSLIDYTYFTGDVNLANGTYDTITESITRYERDILIQLLGYDLYKLVAAYANPGSTQAIIDLVEGKEYTEGDYTVKWNGLVNSEKVSLLAYFVYIKYVENYSVTFQNVGGVASTAEGGQMTGGLGLIRRAGHKLRELAGYTGQDIYAPSLYNFLNHHSSDYATWQWNEYKPTNELGI